MKVSSAEFIKNYGSLSDKALQEPVTITRNGRDRLVLISTEEYARLRASYRRAIKIEDLSDEDMELISKAEVPAEYAHLDELLKDWKPEE
jgi:PHD/YefM family antitoxin component YafN of YafNO toxin-antitoxin module